MSRKGISKQQIFEIAKEMVFKNQLPTALKIRAKLSTGSIATIQKYLQEWKIACFKSYFPTKELNLDPYNSELVEKHRILQQTLNKCTTQNEHYAQELINAEKANISLKEEIHQLQAIIQTLQLKITEATAINNTLEKVNQKIQNKLDFNDNETTKKMQQTIDELRSELKKLNETCITALRETSAKGHDALMQEKVASINLQAKIDSLNKELTESRKQLDIEVMKTKIQTQPLLRQIEWLQTMLHEHLGLEKEKLCQLEEEVAQLNFNDQAGVAVYGK